MMAMLYQLSKEEVLSRLKSSASGLKNDAIGSLQKEFGKNKLQEAKRKNKLTIFLSQFKDIMILILAVAAVISYVVGEHIDAYVILAIIFANAVIGFYEEYSAEESVKMLQKMTSQFAVAIRDNNPVKIEASELVPGDVIVLQAGDIVPADARLIEVNSLKTEEAALTGESNSIDKITDAINKENLSPGDQLNMIFKGTIVSNGSGKAVVTATGMKTEIGKIAGMLEVDYQQTPLQKRLSKFSKQLAIGVIFICVVVFAFGLWRGESSQVMFLTALSLAVAALPEALPAVITIALAQGARRMVKQKALVRKLPAVETLGSVTYICSDKTGTLTQNVMTVEKIQTPPEHESLFLHVMMLNNEVRISDGDKLLGDSTEIALVKYALSQGITKEHSENEFPLVNKIPFDSERMLMSTLHRHENKFVLFVKGAPVKMIEALSPAHKDQIPGWIETNRAWAAEGLRVLFFAFRYFDQEPAEVNHTLEKDLEFLGMTGMIDPPREEVIDAIQQCKTAGIKSVMITGDQALTAYAVAQRLQMIEPGSQEARTGEYLQKLTDEEFNKQIKTIQVFARVSPEQKLNIVKALQSQGEFVAMTGDGVNDAPSLKQSDIGVAMGITGTDVSKEASDMILLDDNFATIVKAVKEGRRIYDNIKKFILYVLSCNLAEILTIFFAPVFGFVIPLLPTHILWINLVTDGLPGLALVAEPAEKDIMKRPPIPPQENLFAGGMIWHIVFTSVIMTVAALLVQWWGMNQGYDVRTQQTMVFTTLCFVQLGNALSVRMTKHSFFTPRFFANYNMLITITLTVLLQLGVVYVPFMQPILKSTSLPWEAMRMMLIVVLGCIASIEVVKLMMKRKSGKRITS